MLADPLHLEDFCNIFLLSQNDLVPYLAKLSKYQNIVMAVLHGCKYKSESKVLHYFKLTGWVKIFLRFLLMIFGNLYLHNISLIWYILLSNCCEIDYSLCLHIICKH